MDLSIEKLNYMRHLDTIDLKREELSNAEDIVIDTEKCMKDRIKSFMEQTKNPFAQNIGDYVLQIGFEEETEETINDRMILLMKRKMQIML